MASAKGARIEAPKALSRVVYEEGCPLASRLDGLGTVVSCPSGVRNGAPAETHFGIFLGHRKLLADRKKCDFLSSVMHKINVSV